MPRVPGAGAREWCYRLQRSRGRWQLVVIVMDMWVYSMTVIGIQAESCRPRPPLRLRVINIPIKPCKASYTPSDYSQHSHPEHRIQQQGKHDEFHAQEEKPPDSGGNPLLSQPMNRPRFTMSNTTPDTSQPSANAFACLSCRCCFHWFPSSGGLSLLLRPVESASCHETLPVIRRVASLEHLFEHRVGVRLAARRP